MKNEHFQLIVERMKHDNVNPTCIAFMRLQRDAGLRIGDLLRISRRDVKSSGTIYIRQGKGSKPIIFQVRDDFEFWSNYSKGYYTDIACFNYSYFRRLYERYGLRINRENHTNATSTHIFRVELAQRIFDDTGSADFASAALGHQSLKSINYYLRPDQKKIVTKNGILAKNLVAKKGFKSRTINKKTFIYFVGS